MPTQGSPFFYADLHCDTLGKISGGKVSLTEPSPGLHLDLPRLRQAGVRVQFFAAFIESAFKPAGALRRALSLLDLFYREAEKAAPLLGLALDYPGLTEILAAGKTAAVLSVEGGEALEGELGVLRMLHKLGVRSLTLTWNQANQLGDGVGEPAGRGLTGFGREVISEMNRLKMLVDLSHLAERGFWEAMEVCAAPPLVTHACCRSLWDHPRNLWDEQLLALAKKGGIIGIAFAPQFLGGGENLERVIEHIEHACGIAGPAAVALGSDFDGLERLPEGLPGVEALPRLAEGLLRKNMAEDLVRGIAGGNFLAYLKRVWA